MQRSPAARAQAAAPADASTGTVTGRVLDSSSGNYLEGAEVAISGTARSAGEAYTLYNSIRTEPELGLLNWSMVQPNLSDNGTASFEITGKPR